MTVRKGSGFTTNERNDLRWKAGNDVMIVDIKRRGEIMIIIGNIDNQRGREPGDRPARRLDWQKIIRLGGEAARSSSDISKMYFSLWKPPEVSERMWSVN